MLTLGISKKIIVILLSLSKSKIILTAKLSWEKLDASAFLDYLINIPPWLLRLKVSTSSELYANTLGSLFLFLLFRMLRHPVFNSHSCDLRDAMPRQTSPLFSHLGKQRISLRVAIILNMCLCPHA